MQHEYLRVPITALAFFKPNIILSGEGTYLHAYDTNLATLSQKRKIFETQAIHGIITLENEIPASIVLVWGGPLFRILSIDSKDDRFEVTLRDTLNVGDWILDAAFAPLPQNRRAALVTAHNALSTARIHQNSAAEQGVRLLHHVKGGNTIVYSAHLTWSNPCQCLIASGTAFGDVSVWAAFFNHDGEDGATQSCSRTETYFTFSAHEGSVFGVRLSSQLCIDGFEYGRLLATCSDDRTIRIWDISDLSKPRESIPVQRTTGFGPRVVAGESYAPRSVAKAMGHISRIWQVRFSPARERDEVLRILSFGEDAGVVTWALSPIGNGEGGAYHLTQLDVTRHHAGKNIWAVASSSSSISGNHLVATGGADGAIALFPAAHPSSQQSTEIPWSVVGESRSSDNFRAYDFISTNVLVATTDRGRIVLVNLSGEADMVQTEEISPELDGLRGYSFVLCVAGRAFVGGTDGAVYAYAYENKRLETLLRIGGKVAGLFPCEDIDGRVALLVTGVGATIAELLLLEGEEQKKGMQGDLKTMLKLDLPAGFITTSFAHHVGQSSNYAVLGSRHGSLLLVSYSNNTQTTHQKLYPGVHSKDAITALHWHHQSAFLPSSSSVATPIPTNYLISTARDGTIAIHALHLHPHVSAIPSLSLSLVHQLSLPFGPNIEGLHVDPTNDTLLAWGFKSKNFIVYDCISQREILAVECGGAHRNWAFQPPRPTRGAGAGEGGGGWQGACFVWTKTSRLFYSRRRRQREDALEDKEEGLSCRLLKPGGHGREIKAMAVEPSLGILATGAEDTDIKLFAITETSSAAAGGGGDEGWGCIQTLRRHNTGVQALAWHCSPLPSSSHSSVSSSALSYRLLSSAGFEEFYIWRLTPGVPHVRGGMGVYCESAHPRSGMSDLRIMGFDVVTSKSGALSSYRPSSAAAEYEEVLCIWMAYSDSTVKLWTYSTPTYTPTRTHRQAKWELCAEGDYLTYCLTHISALHVPVISAQGAHTIRSESGDFMTTSTDGHLALWRRNRADETLAWMERWKVHQNAIHTFASCIGISRTGTRVVVVITGGDDNAISITLLREQQGRKPRRRRMVKIPRTHAAAVTGLAFLRGMSEDGVCWVVSVGLDQRVKIWKVGVGVDLDGEEGSGGVVEVWLWRDVATGVADVSGVEVWPLRNAEGGDGEADGDEVVRVIVCGVGVETWQVSLSLLDDAGVDVGSIRSADG